MFSFIEILRIVPGFEILKNGHDGGVVPAVRGLKAGNRILVMLDGHQVNNPLHGDNFGEFDDFSDTYPQIGIATRNIWSVYLQDTWNIMDL